MGLGDLVLEWNINGHEVRDIDLQKTLTLTVQSFIPNPGVNGGGTGATDVITLNYGFDNTGRYQKLIVNIPEARITGNPILFITLQYCPAIS